MPRRAAFLDRAAELRAAALAYYSGDGVQLMDDATYDAGISELRAVLNMKGT